MRPRVVWIPALLAIISTIAPCRAAEDPPQGESVVLRYLWQPGATTYYRFITENDSRTLKTASTEERTSRDRTAIMVRVEVYSVRDDGTARLAMSMTHIRVQHVKSDGPNETYDSAVRQGKESFESKMYGSLVNKLIIIEVTPEGHVQQIQGLSELVQSAISGLDSMGSQAGASGSGFGKFLEQLGVGKGIKEVLDRATSTMLSSDSSSSSAGRRVGETWPVGTKGDTSFMGMEGTSKVTSTFESIDVVNGRRIARISTTGTSSMKRDAKPATDPKLSISLPSFDTTRTTHGVSLFDLDRGRPVRWESQDTGTVKMKEMKMGDQTMSNSEMQMTTSFLIELVGPEESIDPQSDGVMGK